MNRRNLFKIVLAAIAAPKVTPILKAADEPWTEKPIGWISLLGDDGKEWYGPGYSMQPIFKGRWMFNFGPLGRVHDRMITGAQIHLDDFPHEVLDGVSIYRNVSMSSVSPGCGNISVVFLEPIG